MDDRKESSQRATTSQGTVPPTSSTNTGLNVPVPGPNRPVLNYSIQTGEEFALEFMRDRAVPRTAQASVQLPVQPRTGYMDFRGILGVLDPGSAANSVMSTEIPKPNPQAVTENPSSSSTRPVPTPGPPRAMSGRASSAAASDPSRNRRLFCSYGGQILPRPPDGKLRYVGGENRIMRISDDITFEELKRKTAAAYPVDHTIKYHIPGEELDVLISVQNDEDLRTMKEVGIIPDGPGARSGGRMKVRVFLFPYIEIDDAGPSMASTDSDSEVQFQ